MLHKISEKFLNKLELLEERAPKAKQRKILRLSYSKNQIQKSFTVANVLSKEQQDPTCFEY